jgi:cell division protein FtsA
MSSQITAGIDVGTYEVRAVIAEKRNNPASFKVLGTGKAESKGLRHGYIINSADVSKSVFEAVTQAEKASGIKIKKVFLSIGGIGLSSNLSQGSSIVSRADQKITEADIEQAIAVAEESISPAILQNRKIIYSIPTGWKIDGKQSFGRILGLKGVKLEVKVLFVTCIESHLEDLVEAVEDVGIEVVDVVASPIAASFITLSKSQKIAGCVLANIGAETVSIVVFENNIPVSLEVFPIGGSDITHDIALGLKIPIEEAESIKLGGVTSTSVSKKKLEEIVSARLSDIFELIEAHLKKIGKSGLLPAGIIITGGSSSIGMIEDLARNYLRLPSRIASLSFDGSKVELKNSSWSVAYGLCIVASVPEEEERLGIKKQSKHLISRLASIFKQFLP